MKVLVLKQKKQALEQSRTSSPASKSSKSSSSRSQQNISSSTDLEQRVAILDQKITIAEEFNRQFYRAFLEMLWDEIRFQFQCLADQESRRWFASFRDAPATKDLQYHTRYIETFLNGEMTDESLQGFASHIQGAATALSKRNEKQDATFTSNVTLLFQKIAKAAEDSSDPVEAIREVKTLGSRLQMRCQQLIEITTQKERALEDQFERSDALLPLTAKIGETSISRNTRFQELQITDSNTSKCKALYHQTDIAVEVLQVTEPAPISLGKAINPRAPQNYNSMILSKKIQLWIGQLYPKQADYPNDNLLTAVSRYTGRGIFRWPLEYRTVVKLLEAAQRPEALTPEILVDVKRRLERLDHYLKKSARHDDTYRIFRVDDMQEAFDQAYRDQYAKKIEAAFSPTKTRRTFSDDLGQLEETVTSYNKKAFHIDHLPHDQSNLHALVYFIAQRNNAHQSITWKSQVLSNNAYPDLLKILAPLWNAKAPQLYFTVLLISVAFVNAKHKTPLRDLLTAILNGSYDQDVLSATDFTHAKVAWLKNYLPSALDVTVNDNLKNIRDALLGERWLFASKTVSSRLFGANTQNQRDSASDDQSSVAESSLAGTPQQSASWINRSFSHFSPARAAKPQQPIDLTDSTKFSAEALRIAKIIMHKSEDHDEIKDIAETQFTLYKDIIDKKAVLLVTLLAWYIQQRSGEDVNPSDIHKLLNGCRGNLQRWLHNNDAEKMDFSLSEIIRVDQSRKDVRKSCKTLIAEIKTLFPDEKICADAPSRYSSGEIDRSTSTLISGLWASPGRNGYSPIRRDENSPR